MGMDNGSLCVDKKPNIGKVNSNGVSHGTNHTSPKSSGESVNIMKSEAEEGPQVEPSHQNHEAEVVKTTNQETVSPKPEPSKLSEKIITSLEDNVTAGPHMSAHNSSFHSPINTKQSQNYPFSTRRAPKSFTDKYRDDEDNWSIASSAATSRTVKSRVTVEVAPSFRRAQRAAQCKEFYSKLEQKHQALKAEKMEYEARTKILMGPRWKGKASEVKALANPISKSVYNLQLSLIKSDSRGILSGCSVLLASNPEQTDLLSQTCFGRPIITVDKDKQWFQFTFEEAFYLCCHLKCIKIVGSDHGIKTDNEVWEYMSSRRVSFPDFFAAYSHLRVKNWVVRSGCQYGVDYVAYRHHPSLVHSEYGVLVLSQGNGNDRLRVWSDIQCTLRLCGSVAKTLLVLRVSKKDEFVTACLDGYSVEEHTVTRWSPECSREGI